jgi:hypothetical protein
LYFIDIPGGNLSLEPKERFPPDPLPRKPQKTVREFSLFIYLEIIFF